jgi:hypothetical protein
MTKLLAVLLMVMSSAYAQVPTINTGTSAVTPPTGTTVIRSMVDDGHVHVPLQFGFPYFGKTFTNSVMYDNGVVGFFAPATQTTTQVGCDPAVSGSCGGNQWSSQTFNTSIGPSWNYMIAPLHTDLRPVASSVYSTTGDASQMTYRWQNVGEYYNPGNLNTFSLQIKPSGFIGVNYEKVNIGQSNVSVGLTGNASAGEYAQHYFKSAGTVINNTNNNAIPNWNLTGTGVDLCTADPLSSPSCPGYASAYLNQQCTISSLYNPSCPGYASAYFTQQCTANSLYNTNCPGYAAAYLDYQCSLNPLYSTTCQGYQQAYEAQQCGINPLYSTTCSGYAVAYKAQQCSINPLYATDCPGYDVAYKAQQCSINSLYSTTCPGYDVAYKAQQCTANPLYATDCPGYATAYKTQQCSLNALYATDCPGYAVAYKTQQCTANPLYATDCPGYDAAYKNQQCSINPLYATDCAGYQIAYFTQQCNLNGLYDRNCSNYAEAYAKKNVLAESSVVSQTGITKTTNTSTISPSVDSSGEIKIALVADNNVNSVITSSATSASPAQAATATVPLVPAAPPPTTVAVESKQEEKNASSSSVSSSTSNSNSSSSDSKSSTPTARQELQARRQEAARAKAVEAGKNMGDTMGKAADMEAQKQIQNVVIQAMGYTPGFDAYHVRMPDVAGYKPYTVYNNQKTIDNRANLRIFGGTDKLHQDMIELQYTREK